MYEFFVNHFKDHITVNLDDMMMMLPSKKTSNLALRRISSYQKLHQKLKDSILHLNK